MQSNDQSPSLNQSITVIDLTDDIDDDEYEFESLIFQPKKNAHRSTIKSSERNAPATCKDDDNGHTTVIEDLIQPPIITFKEEVSNHDARVIDTDTTGIAKAAPTDNPLETKDDTTGMGNEGTLIADTHDSLLNDETAIGTGDADREMAYDGTSNETTIVTGEVDGKMAYDNTANPTATDFGGIDGQMADNGTTNETEGISTTIRDTTPADANAMDDATAAMDDTTAVTDETRLDMNTIGDIVMALDDTPVNTKDTFHTTMTIDNEYTDRDVTIDDTTMTTEDDHTAIATDYQPYSFYRYDWISNSSTTTCLASTQDRYNTTVNQSITLDQHILNKPTNPNASNCNKSHVNNFFKSCQWSPDGTCILTSSEDRMLRLFDVPSSIYDPSQSETLTLAPSLGILQGESICDVAWFPSMNSQDPTTCCFLSSVRDHPVHLWDATTGKVRASYCVVDHQERFIGPNVLKFNLNGTKIYCGYENMIEIFDVHAPGNNTSTKHSTTPQRKSRKGQKGIISCLDFNPDHSGMYAAGSYSQSIGIYDERTNELCMKLTGMKGNGVTQVKFSVDGYLLYSASRQSNTISCWDVRQSGNILYELNRKGKTNQRITFDLDPTGSVLITGDQDGRVLVYDLTTIDTEDVETKARLLSSWEAHEDVVSGATFNPGYPSVMATCSGQRKFEMQQSDNDSDSDAEAMVVDNTLKIWQLAGQYEWYSMNTGSAAEGMELDAPQ